MLHFHIQFKLLKLYLLHYFKENYYILFNDFDALIALIISKVRFKKKY